MALKRLKAKAVKFFKLPYSIKPLYVKSLVDILNPRDRLIQILYRLTKDSKPAIIPVVEKAKNSNCLKKIVEGQKHTEHSGILGIWELIFVQALILLIKPDTVVETGVAYGASSAMILEAMEINEKGRLYSIDLPTIRKEKNLMHYYIKNYKLKDDDITAVTERKPTGWFIPKHLHYRWELILGNSLIEIPKLLKNLKYIDIFHHDSLHLYEHMIKEFNFVWPKIKRAGYIMSHDIFTRNHSAFSDFAKSINKKAYNFKNEGIIIKNGY